MNIFLKALGLAAIVSGLAGWWLMLQGIVTGKIEFTTKGSAGEIWYSRVDSPTAFWVVIAVHFVFGITFIVLGFFAARSDKPNQPMG